MAKIIGLGGIFLSFKGDKDELHKWYYETLELDMTDYGTGFITGEQLMIITFKRDQLEQPLINLRVDNILEMINKLESIGIATSSISIYNYGKFAWFIDPFGNKIELWEAKPQEYKRMVKTEVKRYQKKLYGNESNIK